MSDRAWRHGLEYAAVTGVARLVRTLPHGAALGMGAGIGRTFHALDGQHRRLTEANLAAAFPNRPSTEIRATGRDVFVHFGRLLVEIMRFSALPPAAMLERCEFDGVEYVEEAHRQGRGALLVTGHFGLWELHGLVHALRCQPIAVVARALDNPKLHLLLEQIRTSTGNRVIYRRGGVRRILRALESNQGVAVLIDQHMHSADSVLVDFFDRPASTTSVVAALALRTGAPVIPVFALPLADGRYRMVYEPPVQPPPSGHPDALREFMQRATDVLEMYVRRYPHLWLWMHRRWRDVEPANVPGMFPSADVEAAADGANRPKPGPPGDETST
jgi:KDO2-lipid IV(A) lauroyltransferase